MLVDWAQLTARRCPSAPERQGRPGAGANTRGTWEPLIGGIAATALFPLTVSSVSSTKRRLGVLLLAAALSSTACGSEPDSDENLVAQMSPEQRAANECTAAVQGSFSIMTAHTLSGQQAQSQAVYEDFYMTVGLDFGEMDTMRWALRQTEALVKGMTTEEAIAEEIGHRCGVS